MSLSEDLIRRDKIRGGLHPHRDQDVVFSYRPPSEVTAGDVAVMHNDPAFKAIEAKIDMLDEMIEVANKFGDAERAEALTVEFRRARAQRKVVVRSFHS